jgi:hypothetical protein
MNCQAKLSTITKIRLDRLIISFTRLLMGRNLQYSEKAEGALRFSEVVQPKIAHIEFPH